MDEYDKKFADMQKYIPFLEVMIDRLRGVKDNSREVQLRKMKQLHGILTSSGRKYVYIDTPWIYYLLPMVVQRMQNSCNFISPIDDDYLSQSHLFISAYYDAFSFGFLLIFIISFSEFCIRFACFSYYFNLKIYLYSSR